MQEKQVRITKYKMYLTFWGIEMIFLGIIFSFFLVNESRINFFFAFILSLLALFLGNIIGFRKLIPINKKDFGEKDFILRKQIPVYIFGFIFFLILELVFFILVLYYYGD